MLVGLQGIGDDAISASCRLGMMLPEDVDVGGGCGAIEDRQ
jgi:hypothetical protein